MVIKFDKILNSKADLETIDRANPYNVVAAAIHTFTNYDILRTECYKTISILL